MRRISYLHSCQERGVKQFPGTLAGHDLAEIASLYIWILDSTDPYIWLWLWAIAIQLTLVSSFVGHVEFLSWGWAGPGRDDRASNHSCWAFGGRLAYPPPPALQWRGQVATLGKKGQCGIGGANIDAYYWVECQGADYPSKFFLPYDQAS